MRTILFWGALIMFGGASAHAGHGTIRETETQIIVEYYGDASDKYDQAAPEVSASSHSGTGQSIPAAIQQPTPQAGVAAAHPARGGQVETPAASNEQASNQVKTFGARSQARAARRHRPTEVVE